MKGVIGCSVYTGPNDKYAGFVPKGYAATICGDKLQVHELERAKVGDVVKLHPELGGWKFTVALSNEIFVTSTIDPLESGWIAEHGRYTIVKRAEQHAHGFPGENVPDECEGHKPEPTTAELVDMLAKREGIEKICMTNEEIGCVKFKNPREDVDGDEWTKHRVNGPARILVVKD